MHKASIIYQRIFGVLLIVFVGMDVFGWEPPPIATEAQPLWDAIIGSGYIMPVVIATYGISGLAFLFDRFAALGAVLLTPVSLNILLFHSFLNPSSIPFAITFFACNALMLYIYRASYSSLLHALPSDRVKE